MTFRLLFSACSLLLAAPVFSQNTPPPEALIVLDASGSMWGKVGEKAKIEIARDAIQDLVNTLPSDTHLGLIAYGHRRKGDCADIELLIPPQKLNPSAFLTAVNGIIPKGMTPLTDSLELAAETLRYTENKASVIIVTDGLETCDRDPCSAAKKLEKAGIDFTAHVIAFDLKAEDALKIKCIASETGGRFLPAQDTATLKDALDLTIQSVIKAEKEEPQPVKEDPATITVPAEVPAGSNFKAEWTGPNGKGDYITIVPKGSKDHHYANYTYTKQGSPLTLKALIKPQLAEVRYRSGRTSKVLGRAPIKITKIQASLEAPDKAIAGSEVEIKWSGPAYDGDYLTIVMATVEDGKYAKYAYAKNPDASLKVTAPIKTGRAEIRYMTGQGGKVLARRPITLTKADLMLDAAAQAVAGASVKITWNGPANKGDYITIVTADTDDGKYAKYAYARDPEAPVKVQAPLKPGKAEIRYMSGQGAKVLTRRSITLTEAKISLDAPTSVVAGSTVKITWDGPANQGDYITIVTADTPDGKYAKYGYARDPEDRLSVQAPLKPGKAELRYMSGQGGKVLARRSIQLTKPVITFEAPESVVAGATVKITWNGPANRGDYITIVTADTDDGKYAKYAYAKDPDDTLKIQAPIRPGKAEIRYMTEQGNKVLARHPITLIKPVITLSVPESATAGSNIKITWSGPANKGDYITIVTADTRDGQYAKYAYAKDPEEPMKVTAPKKAGQAEVRYMTEQGNKVLARHPITLTPAK